MNTSKTVIFVATAKQFQGSKRRPAKKDENGKDPVVLDPIGGKSPRALNVLSGTVAEGQGFKAGTTHLCKAVHMGQADSVINPGQKVDSFNFSSLGTISPMEAVEWAQKDGNELSFMIEPTLPEGSGEILNEEEETVEIETEA